MKEEEQQQIKSSNKKDHKNQNNNQDNAKNKKHLKTKQKTKQKMIMTFHSNGYLSGFTLVSAILFATISCLIVNITATAQHGLECFLLAVLSIAFVTNLVYQQIWPLGILDVYHVHKADSGSILNLAHKCMMAKQDFWVARQFIFWGKRVCVCTSERSVRAVLSYGDVFRRSVLPGNCITSPHSLLGSGGLSKKWKRIRSVCNPYFGYDEYEYRNEAVMEHIIAAVAHAAESSKSKPVNLFQLVNRLVVESHLLVLLEMDSVPAEGVTIPQRDLDSDIVNNKTAIMADIIDKSLNIHGTEAATYTSPDFVPILNFISDRMNLPLEELGGIELILAEAHKNGEIDSIERMHNMVLFMIALAPSPATFWSLVHIFKNNDFVTKIRDEDDEGNKNANDSAKGSVGMAMLAKCVKETLRMYAPVPVMISRDVTDAAAANKHFVSGGSSSIALETGDIIVIPTLIMQNNPNVWVEPNIYNPDRFDTPETMTVQEKSKQFKAMMLRGSGFQPRPKPKSNRNLNGKNNNNHEKKARYFPFGMGKHTCLGQSYATWLTMVITSTIINNFDIEIEDPNGLLEEECSYLRVKDHVYSFPKAPILAKIVQREIDEEDVVPEMNDDDDDYVEEEEEEDVVVTTPTSARKSTRASTNLRTSVMQSKRNTAWRESLAINREAFSGFMNDNDNTLHENEEEDDETNDDHDYVVEEKKDNAAVVRKTSTTKRTSTRTSTNLRTSVMQSKRNTAWRESLAINMEAFSGFMNDNSLLEDGDDDEDDGHGRRNRNNSNIYNSNMSLQEVDEEDEQ